MVGCCPDKRMFSSAAGSPARTRDPCDTAPLRSTGDPRIARSAASRPPRNRTAPTTSARRAAPSRTPGRLATVGDLPALLLGPAVLDPGDRPGSLQRRLHHLRQARASSARRSGDDEPGRGDRSALPLERGRRRRGEAAGLPVSRLLEAYLIAAQDERRVRVYRRGDRGEWRAEPDVYLGGESFELPTLSAPVAVDEMYDGILDGTGGSLLR